MDVSPSTCRYAGGFDIKDAFYRMELPEALSPFFSLDSVTAGEMGWTACEGEAVDPGFCIFPKLRVVPMGWSWAFCLCQHAVERACHAAEGEEEGQTGKYVAAVPCIQQGRSTRSAWSILS